MERVHVDGGGPTHVPAQCLSPPKKVSKQQPRTMFKRRASLSNEQPFCPSSAATGTAVTSQPRGNTNDTKTALVAPTAALSLARVCGPSRSRCGYCGGKRINVLEVNDGHNKVLPITKEDNSNSASANNGPKLRVESAEKIDALTTSKSYGLLFDSLPYDTYEDLINKGWRRSGKHLYRPHNDESCCPALSIRLDSGKFQARSIPQKSKLAGDSANSILVGGSKSQRRVGRNLFRALDVYNSKCFPSGDDSVNASNLANIQLDTSEEAKKATNAVTCKSVKHHHHLKKKSRRFSPNRGSDETFSASQETREFDRSSLQEFEKSEQSFFQEMARSVYKELTKQAIASVTGSAVNDANNKFEKPKWAWWNDSESDEIPKWCAFKLFSQGTSIIASTVACAAASGRSRGALDKLHLARALVDRLKECAKAYLLSNKSSGIRQVTEVIVHEKSGHVHIMIDVSSFSVTAEKMSIQQPQNATDLQADPIQEMISRYERVSQQFNSKAKMNLADKHIQRFLTVRSVPVFESSLQPEVHRLFCLYQSTTHGDYNPFSDFDESSNSRDEVHEYNYYKQKNLPGFLDIDVAYGHLDRDLRDRIKTSYVIFYKFLCETPVPQAPTESNAFLPRNEDGYDINMPFGTYHQQYRLSTSKDAFDGPLVAVGVVDILPHCISSVYAFYDPIFSGQFELGKYTALREIEWVRRASRYRTELKYYYLGYYIHSCRKMNYKAEYKPSELLCPITSKWVDFETAKNVLERRSPVRHCCALVDVPLSNEDETSAAARKQSCVDKMALDIGASAEESQVVRVEMLNPQGRDLVDPVVNEFVNEVGMEMCSRFAIKLS